MTINFFFALIREGKIPSFFVRERIVLSETINNQQPFNILKHLLI